MRAMVLTKPGPVESLPLQLQELPKPKPHSGEVLIRVEVCGVCRTDLHVVEGELPPHKSPVIPGHEVIGTIECRGPDATRFQIGDRVGVAWLHASCGKCAYCKRGDENLCDSPIFTGYDADGGYAEYVVAPEEFIYPIPPGVSSREAAPFLCAGIIGYRALRRSNLHPGEPLGLYGFGASAHIVIQIARYWDCPVYVCTRDEKHQELARRLGAVWVGSAAERPPVKLRSSILFAPAGELVPVALSALDKGGTLAVAGIYMTPIPSMDYEKHLFYERNLRSVTANTRQDGKELLHLAETIPLHTHTQEFPLEAANEALQALKQDRINGAAVLRVAPT
ncbi:MAG TPA: zinc-dependent alcohol dehydrogenase family protein [Chthonomonas sp.]|uniref:zinc-dependent alcohol dehydrogenase family protein n=1 Tax=Chthonomonas sp. TaxID=2282153 RepID=UPI002B4B7F46|nr:zinc-dependent alcohol dehydrogenase family protein [Chthonomonas sp.]HLH80421.1 zinc-dependent alcohol dehydrogenase family protein [Chthonomonas sp.]